MQKLRLIVGVRKILTLTLYVTVTLFPIMFKFLDISLFVELCSRDTAGAVSTLCTTLGSYQVSKLSSVECHPEMSLESQTNISDGRSPSHFPK